MNVYTYQTTGGKDLIYSYLNRLPVDQRVEGYRIIKVLQDEGLDSMITRQLDGKLWEIKFYRHNRIMYVLINKEYIYLLHACQKQKGKAEKFELDTAKQRMKELI